MSSMQKHGRVVLGLLVLIGIMVGLVSFSVPLYRLFCQVTGYGGTTQVGEVLPQRAGLHRVKVSFDANVAPGLPWEFKSVQRSVEVVTGESTLVFFRAKNISDKPATGVATFNVTPVQMGQYFNKVQCFCFENQLLEPGQEMDMPVSFFVDPRMEDDPTVSAVSEVTLSYTFFVAEKDGE